MRVISSNNGWMDFTLQIDFPASLLKVEVTHGGDSPKWPIFGQYFVQQLAGGFELHKSFVSQQQWDGVGDFLKSDM